MNEQDYQKIFEHFTDLSQRYAMGKIQHDTLHEGLKKLLGEVVQAEIKAERRRRRRAFWMTLLLGLLVGGLAGVGYYLWQKGLIQPYLKAGPQRAEKPPH
ncbi:MAG TPA: hypothetical protein VJ873_09175 [bacterium]|nr:hypothetical protein [bacterium]